MPITAEGHRPLLIEEWLPIRELGIESVRERQAVSALPPLSFLHIWWARRPLAASQGVQLAAVLPTWQPDLLRAVDGLRASLDRAWRRRHDAALPDEADVHHYHNWVLYMAGVWGDPVQANEVQAFNKANGIRTVANPFTWKQAYTNKPHVRDLIVLHDLLRLRWGKLPTVLDPTAGGGSIPFTAQRYGLPVLANDLNPVAAAVLQASLVPAAQFGPDLMESLRVGSAALREGLRAHLAEYFPAPGEAEGWLPGNYLWVNTIACPRTGGDVPLAPNWWLSSKSSKSSGRPEAVRPVPVRNADGEPDGIEFEIVIDPESVGFDPDEGSVSRGAAVSPWDGLVTDGEYIKQEAQAGRMWPTLYAIRETRPRRRGRGKESRYRAPDAADRLALAAAAEELDRLREAGELVDLVPDESVPNGLKTGEAIRYGMTEWRDFFAPRQLLVHATFTRLWGELHDQMVDAQGPEQADRVAELLAMMAGKALNWNSKLSTWIPQRETMRSVFDSHNFAFKWTFAEFEGSRELWEFAANQLEYSYFGKTTFEGLARLIQPLVEEGRLDADRTDHVAPSIATVTCGSAAQLSHIDDASIECVNIDPPYYDNVMYAELSDFFYVWHRRMLGRLHPDWFREELADKDNEAVANPSRFVDAGRRKKELASFDYQQKMSAIFVEARRVLCEDGVLVVWFTHKAADAWDTLGTALIEAGFTIETSWPVNTEFANSLHQAGQNSAASTVILVCRKRGSDSEGVFFEEIEADVRRAAVEAVAEFSDTVGVTGVDLQLSTYGPTLSVISSHWPVLSDEAGEDGRARRLRPEEALAVAREEVNRLVKSRLVGHAAQFDDATDFWLLCWANFQAREFPYDEARKLGMSTLDVDDAVQAGLVKKKSGKVELVKPAGRGRSLRTKMADSGRFPTLVDALHHLLNSYRDDGLASTRTWLTDSGYKDERAFLDTLQAAVNAIPRVRTKKGLSVTEAQELEDVVIALFGDQIEIPAEVEELIEAEQTTLEL